MKKPKLNWDNLNEDNLMARRGFEYLHNETDFNNGELTNILTCKKLVSLYNLLTGSRDWINRKKGRSLSGRFFSFKDFYWHYLNGLEVFNVCWRCGLPIKIKRLTFARIVDGHKIIETETRADILTHHIITSKQFHTNCNRMIVEGRCTKCGVLVDEDQIFTNTDRLQFTKVSGKRLQSNNKCMCRELKRLNDNDWNDPRFLVKDYKNKADFPNCLIGKIILLDTFLGKVNKVFDNKIKIINPAGVEKSFPI